MMGFDDSLPIESYQNPKSKNTVLAMGNVFSATDCTCKLQFTLTSPLIMHCLNFEIFDDALDINIHLVHLTPGSPVE